MIKAVIFDVDNTLIDFLRLKRLCLGAAVDAMIDAGLKMDRKEALKIIYEIYDTVGMEDSMIFQRFLKKVLGRIDYKILSYAIIAYRMIRFGLLVPYPGAKRALIKLKEKGLKLAVVSDAPKLKAWLRLSSMRFDDFFDVIVTYEDTMKKKPSKKPFQLALKELGLKPEECLMVGDMLQKDVKGAKSLGMYSCFARYGYHGTVKNMDADFVIDAIIDVVGVVDSVNCKK